MTSEQVGGIVRAVASAIGGCLVGKGVIDADTAVQVTGVAAVVGTAVWSILVKRKSA